jgi:hypothetical protein
MDIMRTLTGKGSDDGYTNRVFAFNYPVCGWAGQPVYLGSECVIDGNGPLWGIIYHEYAHVMLPHVFSQKFPGLQKFVVNGQEVHDWGRFGEGWATLAGMYTIHTLTKHARRYGISRRIARSLEHELDKNRHFFVVDELGIDSLWKYENVHNNDFSKLSGNIMDGMFIALAERYPGLNPRGWEVYPRFFKFFLPRAWPYYDTVQPGRGEDFMVAALSAAAGHDLRPLFVGRWKFPIEDAYFESVYALLARDSDHDGQPDVVDNCPEVFNPFQADFDRDGAGNACK